jgi:hypothetical protein
MKRLTAGGLVLLIAAPVGAILGYLVADRLHMALYRFILFFDYLSASSLLRWLRVAAWLLFIAMHRHLPTALASSSFLGGVGGVWLSVWLNRRLWHRRECQE